MFNSNVLNLIPLLVALFCAIKLLSRRRLPLPPGPHGYPIIGNLFDVPKVSDKAWEIYAKLGAQYGGIMSYKIFNQTLIILNDPDIVVEMLDKKGSIYSDRPHQPMLVLCDYTTVALPLMSYNRRLRDGRKLLFKVLGTMQAVQRFSPVQDHHSTLLIQRILSQPDEFDKAIRKTAGGLLLDVTYGYKVKEDGGDPFVDAIETLIGKFSEIATPGRFLVDVFPALQHLAPDWLPFTPHYKRYAAYCRKLQDFTKNENFNFVKEGMKRGTSPPSFVADLLTDLDEGATDYKDIIMTIKCTALSFYGAGTDTTTGTTLSYFLAVLAYPEVQQNLQSEIDRVIGKDRLPSILDRQTLDMPYLEAVVKELFRWMPPTPLALPHRCSEDDVHRDFFIPKGSVILANTWLFLHDPTRYKDPMKFDPSRFLGPNPERSPMDFCFGYGRRICAGMKLAESTIWINIAKIASALQVEKAKDEHGNLIEPVLEQVGGFLPHPVPFKCAIEIRRPEVANLIAEGSLMNEPGGL